MFDRIAKIVASKLKKKEENKSLYSVSTAHSKSPPTFSLENISPKAFIIQQRLANLVKHKDKPMKPHQETSNSEPLSKGVINLDTVQRK